MYEDTIVPILANVGVNITQPFILGIGKNFFSHIIKLIQFKSYKLT